MNSDNKTGHNNNNEDMLNRITTHIHILIDANMYSRHQHSIRKFKICVYFGLTPDHGITSNRVAISRRTITLVMNHVSLHLAPFD